MQSFTSHNVVIVPVISKNYLIILSVYLTFLFVSISAMQIVQHTSPNSGDIPLHAGSGKSPLSSGCLPYAAGYAATGCATRIPLAISDLGIFRVVKMPTLKMVNSLLLSDLLVACPLNSRCSRQQGCPCGDLPPSALEGGAGPHRGFLLPVTRLLSSTLRLVKRNLFSKIHHKSLPTYFLKAY